MYNTNSLDSAGAGAMYALIGLAFLFLLVLFIFSYVISGLVYTKLAKKANLPNPWLAWVPFGAYYLLFKLTKLPIWYIILPAIYYMSGSFYSIDSPFKFIVLIAFFISIIVWHGKLLESFGEDKAIAFFHLIPVFGSIVVTVVIVKMAFGKNEYLFKEYSSYGIQEG